MVWKSVFTSDLFQPRFLAPFQPLQEVKEGLGRSRREGREHPFYSASTQVQVRLQFLAMIFSNQVSPEGFRLNRSQVSVLWESLACDPATSDDLFQVRERLEGVDLLGNRPSPC